MGYKESYKNDFTKYQEILKKYEEITSDRKYLTVCEEMPFAFLDAKQKTEMLELYRDTNRKEDAPFKFSRADDAITFFRSIIDLRKKMDEILENATIVVKASEIAQELNTFVDNSPYLSKDLKVCEDTRLVNIAKDCLEKLPNYPQLMTKAFRISFLESCVNSLTEDGLKVIIKTGYIKAEDMQNIRLTGSDKYEGNVAFLLKEFGIDNPVLEHHSIRLAGTSKNNEDGTSRQSILKKMAEEDVKNVVLTCEKGIYKPEVGKELNSVAVNWNGQTAGYVPQAVVDQMMEKYEEPQYQAKLEKVIGGGSVNYGCQVDLGVTAKELKKEQEVEEEKA